ncbi:hypothetical protein BKA70DRAFT_1345169 [Coprinopsis sp. MPI-PUGE-AT-0042]|nr:hypothetical protein BKA70DRAFT_1345169 [Coprinopsis sp. MPI-PUGE-AT-0042]
MPSGFSRRKKIDAGDGHQHLADDVVILLLGVTGCGKSTFINDIIGCLNAKVTDAFEPVGGLVTSYLACLPKETQYRQHENSCLILVDTPGFDASERQDNDILIQIKQWIIRKYGKSKKFSGIVYLHDISENRMRHCSVLNLTHLGNLWGESRIEAGHGDYALGQG